MTRFIDSRLVKALVMLVGVLILNFLLLRLVPGDPAEIMAGESGMSDPVYVESVRKAYGLDRPLWVQLENHVGHALSLDFGYSYRLQADVMDLIVERLPATLALTGAAFVLSLVIGVGLGVFAGYRAGSRFDYLANMLAVAFYSPVFWLGLMLILVFAVQLRWLPASGTGLEYGGDAGIGTFLKHLVLPAATLSVFYIAVYFRLARSSVSDALVLDFVPTARSKGLSDRAILQRHVLPNALLPILTMAALQAGHLVSGSIAVETIFACPGIGRLGYEALVQRDYNMLLTVLLTTSAMVPLLNLVADILYVRARDRDDLPGADDGAQPDHAGRPPDRGSLQGARHPDEPRRDARARPRAAAAGRHPRPEADRRLLQLPHFRRAAAAGDDRHGGRARAEAADRRRADHRARRDDAGAGARADLQRETGCRCCSSRTISASSPTSPRMWE